MAPAKETMGRDRLTTLCGSIDRVVQARMREGWNIPARLAQALRVLDRQYETQGPTAAALQAVRWEWELLGEERRRQLLRGWSDFGVPASHRQASDFLDSTSLARFLIVNAREAWQEWDAEHSNSRVQVMIQDGTNRKEVVAELRRLLAMVEDHWDELVALRPCDQVFPPQQKSGTPQAPDAPASKQEGEEALTATAAV